MKIFSIMSAYCTYRGWLNPHSLTTAASVAGEAPRPAMRSAGLPLGITWKIKKVKTETRKSTTRLDTSRRAMYRATYRPAMEVVVPMALRRLSPKRFIETVVATSMITGANSRLGVLVMRATPEAIIVPHEGFGACTPAPR